MKTLKTIVIIGLPMLCTVIAPAQNALSIRGLVQSKVIAEYPNLFEPYKHLHARSELLFYEEKNAIGVGYEVVAELNPNFEIGDGCKRVFRGAYVSGVWFSASRRKYCPVNCFAPDIPGSVRE